MNDLRIFDSAYSYNDSGVHIVDALIVKSRFCIRNKNIRFCITFIFYL